MELLAALHAPARIVSRRGTVCESNVNETMGVSEVNRPARITARRATHTATQAPPEITTIYPLRTTEPTAAEVEEIDDHLFMASFMNTSGDSMNEVGVSNSGRSAITFDPRSGARNYPATETITSSAAATSVGVHLHDYEGMQSARNCTPNRIGMTNTDPRLSRPTIALAAGRNLNMYERNLLGLDNVVYSARNSGRAANSTARMDSYYGGQSSLYTHQNIGLVPPLIPMRPVTNNQQSISMMHLYGLEQSSIPTSNNNLLVAPTPRGVLRDRQAHSGNNPTAQPQPHVSSVAPIPQGNEENAEPIPNILTHPAEFVAYINRKIERLFPN